MVNNWVMHGPSRLNLIFNCNIGIVDQAKILCIQHTHAHTHIWSCKHTIKCTLDKQIILVSRYCYAETATICTLYMCCMYFTAPNSIYEFQIKTDQFFDTHSNEFNVKHLIWKCLFDWIELKTAHQSAQLNWLTRWTNEKWLLWFKIFFLTATQKNT